MKLKIISPSEQFKHDRNTINSEEINRFHATIEELLFALEQSTGENTKTEISERREIEHFFTSHPDYDRTNFSVEKDNIDLALKLEGKNEVLFETKAANADADMIGPNKLNVKSFRQAVKYYLDELIQRKNSTVKHIIISNGFDWYIFSAADFYRLFNVSAVTKLYEYHGSKGFYDELKPLIDESAAEIKATYFRLPDYKEKDKHKLQALYKLLSGDWLLRRTQKIDNNQLNTAFFRELLHIMGLEETGSKKKEIKAKKKPDEGSLLENIKTKIEAYGVLNEFQDIKNYGETYEEQLFEISLELVLTWVNRLLFLKLLEGQLYQYHNEDESYKFLDYNQVDEFDVLDTLFFEVLNRPVNTRSKTINERYGFLPYLNSSLFEPTQLEKKVAFISAMKDNLTLPLYSETALINEDKSKDLPTLDYLLKFLGAYNFASHAEDDVYKEKGELINAAVLGLVFEKINGYKEGSFYTPGFITEYMGRETVTRAVIQKFNDKYNTDIENLSELKRFVSKNSYKDDKVKEYNELVNSLKIVDPAVGSGHFLVSVMNIILALKSDLGILSDDNNEPIQCHISIDNDTAVIHRKDNTLFTYRLNSEKKIIPADNALQKGLFHEKRKIIENCLFGVDINPKSVKITRLRLWIELLKNAYYKEESDGLELETLPNIDINIKTGNSLISRFALDSKLKQLAKTESKWDVFSYQNAVKSYKSSTDRQAKRDLEKLISDIKANYKTIIQQKNPKLQSYYRLKQEYDYKFPENGLFAHEPEQDYGGNKEKREKEKQKLYEELQKAKQALEDEKAFYDRNKAFEWRFEFPEVLNENGDFTGFDIVIGNPPYVSVDNKSDTGKFLSSEYNYQQGKSDLFRFFIEKGLILLKPNCFLSYIIPNSFLSIPSCSKLRQFVLKNFTVSEIVNFYGKVFSEASINSIIIGIQNKESQDRVSVVEDYSPKPSFHSLKESLSECKLLKPGFWLENSQSQIKTHVTNQDYAVLQSIEKNSRPLNHYADYTLGMQVYHNSTHSQKDISDRVYHSKKKIDKSYYPEIKGSQIKRYFLDDNSKEYVSYGEWCYNKPDWKFCSGKRIYIREIISRQGLIVSLAESDNIANKAVIIVKPHEMNQTELFLGILNSALVKFYIEKTTEKGIQHLFPRISLSSVRSIPIKIGDTAVAEIISTKVSKILTKKEQNPAADTGALEAEIDQMVYKLYGLTDEEITIVEDSVK